MTPHRQAKQLRRRRRKPKLTREQFFEIQNGVAKGTLGEIGQQYRISSRYVSDIKHKGVPPPPIPPVRSVSPTGTIVCLGWQSGTSARRKKGDRYKIDLLLTADKAGAIIKQCENVIQSDPHPPYNRQADGSYVVSFVSKPQSNPVPPAVLNAAGTAKYRGKPLTEGRHTAVVYSVVLWSSERDEVDGEPVSRCILSLIEVRAYAAWFKP